MYLEIKNRIQNSSNIAILSHVAPDGDNIGSSLALYNTLKNMGANPVYILDDDIPKVYKFLKGAQNIHKPDIVHNFDLVFVLDCGDIERLGKSRMYINNQFVINIDHHISNTYFGDINLIDANSSATGEIIYKLINKLHSAIDREIAECLYTAIVTDTGQFQYSNTTSKTHEIIAELIKNGVNPSYIYKNIYQSQPKEKIMLIKKALESLELYYNDMLSCITLSKQQILESGAKESDTENIINYGRDIDGVEVAVFLKEIDTKKIKVSLRSNSAIDVCKIAMSFGGGGHIRASGCTIKNTLEIAKQLVLDRIIIELGGVYNK